MNNRGVLLNYEVAVNFYRTENGTIMQIFRKIEHDCLFKYNKF